MKLFHRNATALLFEKIHSIRHAHDSWRCIHLTLSDRVERHNRSLRNHFILNGISSALMEEDGYVYLCRDRDIFILFQGRTTPVITKLSQYFADMLAMEEEDEEQLFTLYDLSKDWSTFFTLCFQKSLRDEGWKPTPSYAQRRMATEEATIF